MSNSVYRERAHLVAFLTRIFPATLWRESPEWAIIYIITPAGQLSWHIAQDDLDLFQGTLWTSVNHWDGHDTEKKYLRLDSLNRRVRLPRLRLRAHLRRPR